eukprot:Nk52_evm23s288 gene=Nk52_evmTU23s288
MVQADDSFRGLFGTICKSLKSKRRSLYHVFSGALIRHKPSFISLLDKPAPNAVSRKQLEQGSVVIKGITRKVSPDFIVAALKLSDVLKINEILAAEYLQAGIEQQTRYTSDPFVTAVYLFHSERKFLIASLEELIKSRMNEMLPEDYLTFITDYTDKLFSEGLVGKVLGILTDWEETYASAMPEEKAHLDFEKKSLADVLFYMAYQIEFKKDDVTNLVKLVLKLPQAPQDQVLSPIAMSCLLALTCRLYVPDDINSAPDVNPLFSDFQFMEVFDSLVSAQCENTGMQSVCLLFWSLFLCRVPDGQSAILKENHVNSRLDKAVGQGAFRFLAFQVFDLDSMDLSPDLRELFVEVLDLMMTAFLEGMSHKIQELKLNDEELETSILTNSRFNDVNEEEKNVRRFYFKELLNAIAALYKHSGEGGIKFWEYSNDRDLFKFLRFASDNFASASHMVAYLDVLNSMASSPEGADFAFNFLKAQGSYGSSCSVISWDHFFATIDNYHVTLSQSSAQGISPSDVSIAEAVLRLLGKIVRENEHARVIIFENPSWRPAASLMGLLGCPVPASLKGEILNALSGFAKSPEIAVKIWEFLELTQIVPTSSHAQVSGTRFSNSEGGIVHELEDIESGDERYPELIAFLGLMDVLTNVEPPANLGAAHRIPGIHPYIEFMIKHVLLRFDSRGYVNESEKWESVMYVLKVLYKLLSRYHPATEDFYDAHIDVLGDSHLDAKKPGYILMLQFLNASAVLKKVIGIVDIGVEDLEAKGESARNNPSRTQAYVGMKNCILLSLNLIKLVLEKQGKFMECVKVTNAGVTATFLEELLFTLNVGTVKTPHIESIFKYITFHGCEDICFSAAKILCRLGVSPILQKKLALLLNGSKDKENIMTRFLEKLEVDESETADNIQASFDVDSVNMRACATDIEDSKATAIRLTIMDTIITTLNLPSPNLAHFLLGFDVTRPIRETVFEDKSCRESSKCFDLILELMNHALSSGEGIHICSHCPRLAEFCYEIIYRLCASPVTSGPVMKFLRNSHNFFYLHLKYLPCSGNLIANNNPESFRIVNCLGWLLKTIALELHITVQAGHRVNSKKLLDLLFGVDTYTKAHSDFDERKSMDFRTLSPENKHQGLDQPRIKVLELLDTVDLGRTDFQPPSLDELPKDLLSECQWRCERTNVLFYDIQKLHSFLCGHIGSRDPTSQAKFQEEIRRVLGIVVQWNVCQDVYHARFMFFGAWQQIVEVVMKEGFALIDSNARENVLYELLQALLPKAVSEGTDMIFAGKVTSVILAVMTRLRQYGWTVKGNEGEARKLPVDQLHSILQGLLKAALRPGTTQPLRGNLYGSLLNYCQYVSEENGPSKENLMGPDGFLGVVDSINQSLPSSEMASLRRFLENGNISILNSFGSKFLEELCRDACNGIDIWRALSFGTLDGLMNFDRQGNWLHYIRRAGFLSNFIGSIAAESKELDALLTSNNPDPSFLKTLFIYESRMAFLIKISRSKEGAKILLHDGLLQRLTDCYFIDRRPEEDETSEQSDELSTPRMQVYYQLMLPVLRVIVSLTTSLGAKHQDLARRVIEFVHNHADVLATILKDRSALLTKQSLKELELVSAIFYNLANHEELLRDILGARASRFQHLMLNLLSKFFKKDRWQARLYLQESNEQSDENMVKKQSAEACVQRICINLLSYCRRIMLNLKRAGLPVVLLGPNISNPGFQGGPGGSNFSSVPVTAKGSPPNLSVFVQYLKVSMTSLFASIDDHKQLVFKVEHMNELSNDEVNTLATFSLQYINERSGSDENFLGSFSKDYLVRLHLSRLGEMKKKQIADLVFAIENILYIIWGHLQYYLEEYVPVNKSDYFYTPNSSFRNERGLQSGSLKRPVERSEQWSAIEDTVDPSDLESIRRDSSTLLLPLIDKFSEKGLQSEIQELGNSGLDFVLIISRRLRGLLSNRL